MRYQILIGCAFVMVSAGASAAGPGTGTSTQDTPPPVLLPPPTAKSVEIKKLTDALADAKAALRANKEKMEQLNQTIRGLEDKLRAQDDAMERLRQKITKEVEATLRGQMAVLQKEIEQKSKVASIEPVTAPVASKEVDTPDACPAEWEPSFLVVREYIHTRRPQLEKQIKDHIDTWNSTEDPVRKKEIKAALDANKAELKTIKRRNLPPLPPLTFDTVQVGQVGPLGGEVIVDQVIAPTLVRIRQGKSFGRSQAVFLQGTNTSTMVNGKPYAMPKGLFFVIGVRHFKTQTGARQAEHVIQAVDTKAWLTAYKQWLKLNPRRPGK
jgi:hypothetical protein